MIFRSWLARPKPSIFLWKSVAPCGDRTEAPSETVAASRVRFEGSIRWLHCLIARCWRLGWLRLSWAHLNSGGRFACWFRKVAGRLRCFVWGLTRSSSGEVGGFHMPQHRQQPRDQHSCATTPNVMRKNENACLEDSRVFNNIHANAAIPQKESTRSRPAIPSKECGRRPKAKSKVVSC